MNKTRKPLRLKVAENIRRLRVSLHLSQEALAFEARMHPNYVGGLERGEYNMTVGTIEKIAAALKVHPARLLR